jgi:exodeoxyribonuclease-5
LPEINPVFKDRPLREKIIYDQLCRNLGNTPTDDQALTLRKLADHICDSNSDIIYLLTGYAGTGKTSVISAFVKTLDSLRLNSALLAPTGRAAKVLASYTGKKAFTIHKKIYRQSSIKDGIGSFKLDRNLNRNTYFIVDEASMISN